MSVASSRAAGRLRDLVVLLHGFGGHRAQLVPLSTALSLSGREHGRVLLNHGYKTRRQLLHEHADALVCAVSEQTRALRPECVHFVTHSFGGVVLRAAFARGLADALPNGGSTVRAALIAPPLRGAVIGRNFERMALGARVLPAAARRALRAAARLYMGPWAGRQLLTKPPEWFEKAGCIPKDVDVLVVEGRLPVTSPVVGPELSDGVVTCKETMVSTPHRRVGVTVPHNVMLFSPTVIGLVRDFIDGHTVGELHPGAPLVE